MTSTTEELTPIISYQNKIGNYNFNFVRIIYNNNMFD